MSESNSPNEEKNKMYASLYFVRKREFHFLFSFKYSHKDEEFSKVGAKLIFNFGMLPRVKAGDLIQVRLFPEKPREGVDEYFRNGGRYSFTVLNDWLDSDDSHTFNILSSFECEYSNDLIICEIKINDDVVMTREFVAYLDYPPLQNKED
ncbi:uncharacterized protein LOC144430435 [Styela clava]|uniref:uncharacterized protein LOC120330110 n=1 Tax=Styela clava TaxID=7725 RepID=UPI00193A9EBA|nr:uncharacterized protein LOC120330110 [Styela clava]